MCSEKGRAVANRVDMEVRSIERRTVACLKQFALFPAITNRKLSETFDRRGRAHVLGAQRQRRSGGPKHPD